MDAARWDRVQALFHLASELPAAEREELVAAEAGGDTVLADHVRRLLAADAMGASLLDRPSATWRAACWARRATRRCRPWPSSARTASSAR
jgi:hypothetical protein